MKKYKRNIVAWFTLVLLLSSVLASSAAAAPAPPVTIRFTSESGHPFSGVAFSVYRVAELPVDHRFPLCAPFSSYPITVPDSSTASLWEGFAGTLKGYIARDAIPETAKGTTGADGIVVFPPDLPAWAPGLYLVLGAPITTGSTTITPQPASFLLTGEERQPVLVDPKHSDTPTDPEDPSPVDITVIKKWKGDSDALLPPFVEVQLLKDGVVWDTVRLSPDSQWTHCWQALSPSANWDVVEVTRLDGYTVSIRQDGHTFTITNQKKPTPPEEKPPAPPGEGKLPQTGVVWWPVFTIAGIGLVCLALGLSLRRSDGDRR